MIVCICAVMLCVPNAIADDEGFEDEFEDEVHCVTLTWDGSTTTPASCSYGDSFNVPTPPSRTGYVFTGWKVNP